MVMLRAEDQAITIVVGTLGGVFVIGKAVQVLLGHTAKHQQQRHRRYKYTM